MGYKRVNTQNICTNKKEKLEKLQYQNSNLFTQHSRKQKMLILQKNANKNVQHNSRIWAIKMYKKIKNLQAHVENK